MNGKRGFGSGFHRHCFLPKDYAQFQETIIIGDYVGIAIFTESPYHVLIKDRAVAEGYRKQFEILWKRARK